MFFPAEGGAAGGSYIATAAGSLPKLPVLLSGPEGIGKRAAAEAAAALADARAGGSILDAEKRIY